MECLVLRGAELLKSPHFCKIYEVGKVEGVFRFLITTMVSIYFLVLKFIIKKTCIFDLFEKTDLKLAFVKVELISKG